MSTLLYLLEMKKKHDKLISCEPGYTLTWTEECRPIWSPGGLWRGRFRGEGSALRLRTPAENLAAEAKGITQTDETRKTW